MTDDEKKLDEAAQGSTQPSSGSPTKNKSPDYVQQPGRSNNKGTMSEEG